VNVAIVTPVHNDWESCAILLTRIDGLTLPGVTTLRVLVVDDGSVRPLAEGLTNGLGGGRVGAVSVLELVCNVGHQRAIALGIARIVGCRAAEQIVVMDSDGEDDPDDIPRLIAALQTAPDAGIVAGRTKRSEGARFRVGYAAYQTLFLALVGRRIDFGNFSAFGPALARRLSGMSETWSHLAASLLRSRVPLVTVPTRRGRRYAGQTSMNFPSLIAHGLSAFAVFSDHVFARLLLLAATIGSTALFGIVSVVAIRLATDLAIPGWATNAVSVFALLFIQAVLICLVGALQLLATRSQPAAQPSAMLPLFVCAEHRLELGPRV
jgi:glycosyltransferase involved in cell wall biosynthesis